MVDEDDCGVRPLGDLTPDRAHRIDLHIVVLVAAMGFDKGVNKEKADILALEDVRDLVSVGQTLDLPFPRLAGGDERPIEPGIETDPAGEFGAKVDAMVLHNGRKPAHHLVAVIFLIPDPCFGALVNRKADDVIAADGDSDGGGNGEQRLADTRRGDESSDVASNGDVSEQEFPPLEHGGVKSGAGSEAQGRRRIVAVDAMDRVGQVPFPPRAVDHADEIAAGLIGRVAGQGETGGLAQDFRIRPPAGNPMRDKPDGMVVPAVAPANCGEGLIHRHAADGEATRYRCRGCMWLGRWRWRRDSGSGVGIAGRRLRFRGHERSGIRREGAEQLLDEVSARAPVVGDMHLGALEDTSVLGRPCHRSSETENAARIDD